MHWTFFINENERISRIVYFVYNLSGHIIVLECKDLGLCLWNILIKVTHYLCVQFPVSVCA